MRGASNEYLQRMLVWQGQDGMHNLTATLLLLLGIAGPLSAQAPSAAHCPPTDSLYTDRPPGPARDPLQRGQLYPRYTTYVIDSVHVLANLDVSTPMDSATSPLFYLKPDDIENIEIVKARAASRWNVCTGVPTVLVITKSKTWHPRNSTPSEAPR